MCHFHCFLFVCVCQNGVCMLMIYDKHSLANSCMINDSYLMPNVCSCNLLSNDLRIHPSIHMSICVALRKNHSYEKKKSNMS